MLVPTNPPAGEKAEILCKAVLLVLKLVAEALFPFNFQANDKLSPFTSVPFAVKLILPLTPTIAPVAAGVMDEHTGGIFLSTAHVCVAELEPLLTVATRVFAPVLNRLEFSALVFVEAPLIGLPLSVQVTSQEASLGVTLKELEASAAAAIR